MNNQSLKKKNEIQFLEFRFISVYVYFAKIKSYQRGFKKNINNFSGYQI